MTFDSQQVIMFFSVEVQSSRRLLVRYDCSVGSLIAGSHVISEVIILQLTIVCLPSSL